MQSLGAIPALGLAPESSQGFTTVAFLNKIFSFWCERDLAKSARSRTFAEQGGG